MEFIANHNKTYLCAKKRGSRQSQILYKNRKVKKKRFIFHICFAIKKRIYKIFFRYTGTEQELIQLCDELNAPEKCTFRVKIMVNIIA